MTDWSLFWNQYTNISWCNYYDKPLFVYLLYCVTIDCIKFSSAIKCNWGFDSYLLLLYSHVFRPSMALSIQFSVCVSFVGENKSQITPISSFNSFGSSSFSVTVTPIESQCSYCWYNSIVAHLFLLQQLYLQLLQQQLVLLLESLQSLQ